MKKALFLCLTLITATFGFAQNFSIKQFATLSRNDTIIGTYYGSNALYQAINASSSGDVINLSSGNFSTNNYSIQRSLTIRGIGHTTDSVTEMEPTIIHGTLYFGAYASFFMEGVYLESLNVSGQSSNNRISKCKITTFDSHSGNNTISNCIIDNYIETCGDANTLINNVILNYIQNYTYCGNNPRSNVFHNCILGISPALTDYLFINNCITFYNDTIPSQGNANYVYNTVGIKPNDTSAFYQDRAGHNNQTAHSFSSIFKTFNGTYTDGETFELQDNIANTLLGSDSTQIGIYGGSLPFNSRITDPRIRHYSVDLNSNSNNQLNVYIELDNSNN